MSAAALVVLVAMVVFIVALLIKVLVPVLCIALGALVVWIIWRLLQRSNNRSKGSKEERARAIYTVIKEIDLYEERLEPAWEYPDPDDQWLFAEEVKEYVGTEYDVLYVYDDNTYKERRGLKSIPADALRIARDDLSYDATKCRLKRRWC